jgi:hypothetical protein
MKLKKAYLFGMIFYISACTSFEKASIVPERQPASASRDCTYELRNPSQDQLNACGYVQNEFALGCVRRIRNPGIDEIKYCGRYINSDDSLSCVERTSNPSLSDIRRCGK